ncbi:ExbD/TolR family protein [Teredinibacter sp. KSP-S5-2]|uniref:ExbD/TolR family protein n=1 Tax=Teredinibacter sp. KSP-S5-2 TaxID=3034506 RepID=UPI002934D121|nr:biopolymer transporter ExbD [Teredinibacter sp. KSP-S5-2]WNO08963.1 biopolymer transporter ExbD [Teredinibacter sp. KSP-S5-2]
MRHRRFRQQEADLDITSFMNLMIILVPVLLMSMVFSHITVLDLKLPDLASNSGPNKDPKNELLELVIEPNELVINYPAGAPLKRIPLKENDDTGAQEYDFKTLSVVLQEVKRLLREKGIDKKDILILSQQDTDYQTIVRAMDTVRSFKAVVAASVVDAELFPQVSLGDAPPPVQGTSTVGGKQ